MKQVERRWKNCEEDQSGNLKKRGAGNRAGQRRLTKNRCAGRHTEPDTKTEQRSQWKNTFTQSHSDGTAVTMTAAGSNWYYFFRSPLFLFYSNIIFLFFFSISRGFAEMKSDFSNLFLSQVLLGFHILPRSSRSTLLWLCLGLNITRLNSGKMTRDTWFQMGCELLPPGWKFCVWLSNHHSSWHFCSFYVGKPSTSAKSSGQLQVH